MHALTPTQVRKEIYKLFELVEKNHEVVQITGKKSNMILLSESDWNAIQETLYLLAIPGMRDSIKKGLKTSPEKFDKELDW
jgi:antitoxin YefM